MYYCCGVTYKGNVRESNEDAFLLNKKVVSDGAFEVQTKRPFAAVADGVAGENGGEVASLYALKRLAAVKASSKTDYVKKVLAIHNQLRRRGIKMNYRNMQTTLCALSVDKTNTARVINVGDSRLYRYRDGVIKQLSTDQSLVQVLYEQGSITPEEKIRHSQKNIIFPVLGCLDSEPNVTVTEIGEMKVGDTILLCTDGLSDYATAGDMEESLSLPSKMLRRVIDLIVRAENNGSPDNITAMAIFRQK